jgi:hypothetical protein
MPPFIVQGARVTRLGLAESVTTSNSYSIYNYHSYNPYLKLHIRVYLAPQVFSWALAHPVPVLPTRAHEVPGYHVPDISPRVLFDEADAT